MNSLHSSSHPPNASAPPASCSYPPDSDEQIPFPHHLLLMSATSARLSPRPLFHGYLRKANALFPHHSAGLAAPTAPPSSHAYRTEFRQTPVYASGDCPQEWRACLPNIALAASCAIIPPQCATVMCIAHSPKFLGPSTRRIATCPLRKCTDFPIFPPGPPTCPSRRNSPRARPILLSGASGV